MNVIGHWWGDTDSFYVMTNILTQTSSTQLGNNHRTENRLQDHHCEIGHSATPTRGTYTEGEGEPDWLLVTTTTVLFDSFLDLKFRLNHCSSHQLVHIADTESLILTFSWWAATHYEGKGAQFPTVLLYTGQRHRWCYYTQSRDI